MWTTIYIAMGEESAHDIENRLTLEGFMVKTKFLTKEKGVSLYEILAPDFEAEEIQLCMMELGII